MLLMDIHKIPWARKMEIARDVLGNYRGTSGLVVLAEEHAARLLEESYLNEDIHIRYYGVDYLDAKLRKHTMSMDAKSLTMPERLNAHRFRFLHYWHAIAFVRELKKAYDAE